MTSLDYKVALLVAAVLVGLPAWPAGAPSGGEVDAGRSGAGRSSLCRRNRLIYLACGPPHASFRRMRRGSRPTSSDIGRIKSRSGAG